MSITSRILEGNERITYPASIFGIHFPFRVEPFIFTMARSLSRDYTGGYWEMICLSNEGFLMIPKSDQQYHVMSQNGFEGDFSASGFGITVCLFAFSHLSFSEDLAETGEQFHLLRDFALNHPECNAIMAAID